MQTARPVLFLLFALPFTTAYAVPLIVDYEGTISEVSDAPPEYVVGNRIAGRLLIDPSVPWYISDPSPNGASYFSDDPSFVSGFWPSSGDGFDRVFVGDEIVRDGGNGPIDVFGVADWLVGTNASQDGGRQFSISAYVHGFLTSTTLDQSFELTSADIDESDEGLIGGINFRIDLPSFVRFGIERLSVRPGRCSAP